MKLHMRDIALVCMALLLLLSACGTSSTNSNINNGKNGVIPDKLSTIEALAEDIIDFVPSGEWPKVNSDISAIEKAWVTYQPLAVKDGATQATQDFFSESLARLKSSAESQSATETMQAANNLSSAVVDMFDLYNPVIPADIGRLDVLERQIILDMANQDFTAAGEILVKINAVWESVKPSISEHNGQKVSEQFDNSLSTQMSAQKAQDSKGLTDEAKNALEIVDALERLY
jgi:hypothetical protein